MGTTTNYAFPYPDAGASNNVPSDTQGLAAAVDAELKTIHDGLNAAIPVGDSTAGDISASAPGDTKAAGVSAEFARADHRHSREAAAAALAGPADLTVFSAALTTIAAATGTQNLDLSAAREFKVTMTGNCTFAFTNVPATIGKVYSWVVRLIQDSTGSRLPTWPAAVAWGTQGAPVLSTTPGKSDYLVFRTDDGGATIQGFIAGEGY